MTNLVVGRLSLCQCCCGSRTSLDEDDRNDESVDTEHTCHDDGDDVLHDGLVVHDSHGADADAALGGSVGGAEVGEHQRRRHAHESEERGGVSAVETRLSGVHIAGGEQERLHGEEDEDERRGE